MNAAVRAGVAMCRQVLLAALATHRNRYGTRALGWAIAACAALPLTCLVPLARLPEPAIAPVLGCRLAAPLAVAWLWGAFVAQALAQNRAALARLVPGHLRALRLALATAWAAAVAVLWLCAAMGLSPSLGAAELAGIAMLAIALVVRWRVLLFLEAVALFAALALPSLSAAVTGFRDAFPALFAAIVLASCATLVAALPSRGGERTRLAQWLEAAPPGSAGRTRGPAHASSAARFTGAAYSAWMRYQVLRPRASPAARLLAGIGPSAHWTVRAAIAGAVVAVGLVLLACIGVSPRGSGNAGAVAVMILLVMAAQVAHLQAIEQRMLESAREQALLMLLPGVARGAALSRALAMRLTAAMLADIVFGTMLLEAFVLAAARLGAFAAAPAIFVPPIVALSVATLLPRLWRPWARVRAKPAMRGVDPVTVLLLAFLAFVAGSHGWLPTWAVAALYALLTIARVAWRWRRMADEPAAFPAGRHATRT